MSGTATSGSRPAEALPTERKPGRNRPGRSEARFGYLLLVPMGLVVFGLIGYPLVISVWYSFTDKVIGPVAGQWVGLENYISRWNDPIFQRAVVNTINYAVTAVFVKLLIGTIMAVLLYEMRKFKRVWRALFVLPWVIPSSLSVLGWVWMFDAQASVINAFLRLTGIREEIIRWLGEPGLAMAAVQTVNIWRGSPFFGIMILAGMATVDKTLMEAAAVDGASAWHRFRHVMIPHLKPVLMVVTLFSFVLTMGEFQIVWLLTKGGPQNGTHLISTLSFNNAVQSGNIGQGAAVTLFLFPILLLIIWLQLRALRSEE